VGDETEIVVCEANMQVTTAEPVQDAQGVPQVPIQVANWVAKGRSRLLNTDLEFQLTPGPSPLSTLTGFAGGAPQSGAGTVTPTGPGAAFPAQLDFVMNYQMTATMRSDGALAAGGDVFAGGQPTVVGRATNLRGNAVGTITSFPPKPTDTFEIRSKAIQLNTAQGLAEVGGLMCAC